MGVAAKGLWDIRSTGCARWHCFGSENLASVGTWKCCCVVYEKKTGRSLIYSCWSGFKSNYLQRSEWIGGGFSEGLTFEGSDQVFVRTFFGYFIRLLSEELAAACSLLPNKVGLQTQLWTNTVIRCKINTLLWKQRSLFVGGAISAPHHFTGIQPCGQTNCRRSQLLPAIHSRPQPNTVRQLSNGKCWQIVEVEFISFRRNFRTSLGFGQGGNSPRLLTSSPFSLLKRCEGLQKLMEKNKPGAATKSNCQATLESSNEGGSGMMCHWCVMDPEMEGIRSFWWGKKSCPRFSGRRSSLSPAIDNTSLLKSKNTTTTKNLIYPSTNIAPGTELLILKKIWSLTNTTAYCLGELTANWSNGKDPIG